jgi:hypothetical protein
MESAQPVCVELIRLDRSQLGLATRRLVEAFDFIAAA